MSHQNKIIDRVKESYTAIASEFDQTRKRAWPEFEDFLKYVNKGARVLDVGCGNGRLYDFFKEKEIDYLGVDHNSSLLKKAQKNFPEARFKLQDMTDLDLEEGPFDNLFCIAAFHHLPTRQLRKNVLATFHRSLRKDGVLILTTWNLFQKKYWKELLKAALRCIFTLGLKGSWNDLWIKWGQYPLKRYYHSFLPGELRRLFERGKWQIEVLYFSNKGRRTSLWRSFNLVLIARKR